MALLFTILLGLSAGVLGYFSYYFNRGHYIDSAGALIDTDMGYLVAAARRGELAATIDASAGHAGRLYLLEDGRHRRLAGNLARLPDGVGVLTEGTIVFEDKGRFYAAKVHLFPDGGVLLAGIDITSAALSYRVMQWLSLASIALMAIVVGVSFLISTFVVSRTNRIAATAKAIMDTGDLSKRIAIDARWDDLSNMASVLNAFLERVEQLMQGIRRVSDNVAHDLRTPLTRLLNNLETLRDQPAMADDENTKSRCEAMIAETHRLLDTFNALLRITRIETVRQRQNFAPLDLRDIISDVVELYEPLAEEKNITVRAVLDASPVTGDRDLLFQAAANLVDNAIKFTPEGGRIEITVRKGDRIHLTVRDTGPGIPHAEREKVFDRFYRSDASRSADGNGLGLTLVAAVIGLHDGSIILADAEPGLAVEIVL